MKCQTILFYLIASLFLVFTVSAAPYIVYDIGSTNTSTLGNQNWIFINATSNDTSLNYTTIYLYNMTELVSTQTGEGNLSYNFTSLAYGTYFVNITMNDSSNNINYSDTRNISLWEGLGNSVNPYNITDCYKLQSMSYNLTASYALKNNINCSITNTWDNGLGFKPVGDNTNKSSVSLNGNNFIINNLFINRSVDYVGLFGYSLNTTLSNLVLANSTIIGNNYVGIIAGKSDNASVSNIKLNATVSGVSYIGGIFGAAGSVANYCNVSQITANLTMNATSNYLGGIIGSTSFCNLINVSNNGTVRGQNYTGGIVGYSAASSSVDSAYFSGMIYGNQRVGGIAGLCMLVGNSYTFSNITSSTYTGGICGEGTTVYDSYVNSNITGYSVVGGILGLASSSSYNINNALAIVSLNVSSGSGAGIISSPIGEHVTSSAWYEVPVLGEFPTCGVNNGCTKYTGTQISYFIGLPHIDPIVYWPFYGTWNAMLTDLPVLDWQKINSSINISFSYNITTCEEFQDIYLDLTGTYNIMNDLDCSDSINWDSGLGFQTIASGDYSTNPHACFQGTINGNNKYIRNITMNRPSEEFVSVFGCVGSWPITQGTIKNLYFDNLTVTGAGWTGGLFSQAYGLELSNLHITKGIITAVIGSGSAAGGIASMLGSNITNSSFQGTIYCGDYSPCGGIGGWVYSDNVEIKNSYTNVTLSGNDQIGGIIGTASYINSTTKYIKLIINNSYSQGSIEGTGDETFIGGIMGGLFLMNGGVNLSILNSYSLVNLSLGSMGMGGIISTINAKNNVSVVNSFYAGNISNPNSGNPYDGINGLFSGEIINGARLNITNFSYFNSSFNKLFPLNGTSRQSNITATAINDSVYFKGDFYPYNNPFKYWSFYDIWGEDMFSYPILSWQNTGKVNISFIPQSTSVGSYSTLNFIYVNLSVISNSVYRENITLRNTTSIINSSNQLSINFTNLPDSVYYLNASINDTFGNFNTTETRMIIIDQTAPVITLVSPVAISYPYNNIITLNYTVYEPTSNISYCWYKLVDSGNNLIVDNVTLSNCGNLTLQELADDDYNITVYSNNTLNSIGTKTLRFRVSSTKPAVVLNYPGENGFVNSSTINFTFTAVSGKAMTSCVFYFDNLVNYTYNNPSSGTTYNVTIFNLSNRLYNWTVKCTDIEDGVGLPVSNYTATVDTVYPILNLDLPGPIYYSYSTIPINFSYTELNILSCYYNLTYDDGTGNYIIYRTDVSVPNCSNMTFDVYDSHLYKLIFIMNDKAGNKVTGSKYFSAYQSVSAVPPPSGGGSSYTPPPSQEEINNTINQKLAESSICGNGVCQDGENPITCSQDCRVNVDELFCFLGTQKTCAAWVFNAFIWIIIGFVIYTTYDRQIKNKSRT